MSEGAATDAARAADVAARSGYGRLLAYLAARSRDVAAAEDALSDAFASALSTWPMRGVPDNPEAWLLTAARRKLIDGARKANTRSAAEPDLRVLAEEARDKMAADAFPDERLKLLFICAHPAIDPAVRTPLMLQTVLGLSADRIASAFLTAPATMSQRLVRAKAKLKQAGAAFETPDAAHWPERLDSVLAAIYAAYGAGWEDVDGGDDRQTGLAAEALWLAELTAGLAPDAAEARGLLALILFCESRRPARRGPDGAFIPLSEQDPALWRGDMIDAAEAELLRASALRMPGRFQFEAAIQSVHARRRVGDPINWAAVAALYDMLRRIAPSLGAEVGRAAALGEAAGAQAGLDALDALPQDRLKTYQPYWATRGHLLAQAGRAEEAAADLNRAAGLSDDPAVRAFLLNKVSGFGGD